MENLDSSTPRLTLCIYFSSHRAVANSLVPAACAPLMHCLPFSRLMVSRLRQAFHHFLFLVGQFIPGPQVFLMTSGTFSVDIHLSPPLV